MANEDRDGKGKLYYEQYLAERPYHGRYRIVAVTGRGETVDSVTVEFNCFAGVSEE
ncbi:MULTISPECIES: 5-formyltetrahydrofolate cyclo-ligase [Halorussus]|uniref:5-formyltetrahydrofolate cyclo-ligase n=1 Tax=Halorussus TaxID=1070314 RepID=UPI0020A02B2A|nr:5-formyltetrahydrofolate cyclo-ligase [Halorussus vallis]USZ75577.1 5-formyltetrahydrofolate cyclo-ligase [Halorussus vallis]